MCIFDMLYFMYLIMCVWMLKYVVVIWYLKFLKVENEIKFRICYLLEFLNKFKYLVFESKKFVVLL